ncbi:hypothetical protein [Roseateles sp.]|uniref:hypothetical protein n=1 Tax=Roseateles sp. TaxID=1971397 RepID=UPI003D0AF4D1
MPVVLSSAQPSRSEFHHKRQAPEKNARVCHLSFGVSRASWPPGLEARRRPDDLCVGVWRVDCFAAVRTLCKLSVVCRPVAFLADSDFAAQKRPFNFFGSSEG